MSRRARATLRGAPKPWACRYTRPVIARDELGRAPARDSRDRGAGVGVAAGARVIVVDRDAATRRALARVLLAGGGEVSTAEDVATAVPLARSRKVDVAVVEVAEGASTDGVDELARHARLVLLAAAGSLDRAIGIAKASGCSVLARPLADDRLLALAVEEARRRAPAGSTEGASRAAEPGDASIELLGTTPEIREARRAIAAVAASSTPVLVVGEAGTGRWLVARAIHAATAATGRCVRLDAAALGEQGLARAFFGAAPPDPLEPFPDTRSGAFGAAARGTVCIDDVTALTPTMQLALSRALSPAVARERRDDELPRVVAVTAGELGPRVASGAFRDDLARRLGAVTIRLPPLRRRRADIPLLAYHFVRTHSERLGRAPMRVSAETIRELRRRPWIGNVAELETCIERAVALSVRDVVVPGDLAPEESPVRAVDAAEPTAAWDGLDYAHARRAAIEAFDRGYLTSLLARAGGNVSEAARLAGLDRSNFRRALRRAGLDRR